MSNSSLVWSIVKGMSDKIFISEKAYQKRKLRRMLRNAKENSSLYREMYKDIDVDKITPDNITQLPPITKSEILARYDDWVCDSEVHKSDVVEFASDLNNLDKLYLGRYVVDSTSGTTGEKLKVLNEKKDFDYMMAMGALDTWPKKSYAFDIFKSRRPVVYLLPTDGFYASLMISNTYLGLTKSKNSEIIDFRIPIGELVERLNRINPILIGGYASTMLILADEAESGRLRINTKYFVAIGTKYSDEAKERIRSVFKCQTFTSYSSTEAGEIGGECVNGHYHLLRDVIVEAADEKLHPVEDGKTSDCLLITNLWNKSAPFIRYQLNDRCIIHSERCGCGRKSKWIEVIGRELMRIPFTARDGKTVQLTDFTFELMLNDLFNGMADHQLVINGNSVEVRLRIPDEAVRKDKYERLTARLEHTASINNIEMQIRLSDIEPVIENTGKFKRIIVIEK